MKPPPRTLILPLVIWLATSLAMAIAGPFGTVGLPVEDRLPFWLLLMGVNMLKWQAWYMAGYRLLPKGWKSHAALALAGALVVNLPLPLEINGVAWLVGLPVTVGYWPVYSVAIVIALLVSAVTMVFVHVGKAEPVDGGAPAAVPAAEPEMGQPPAPAFVLSPTGLLARAGLAGPEGLLAVEAEDHYLRLHLADGRSPLVHYRFRDALADLAGLDGLQVHRGYWVAAGAVQGLERREGRKWSLRLTSGLSVPISDTFLPAVRQRGWGSRAA